MTKHTACISRKHKQISRKTNLLQNTTFFEESATWEVVTDELHMLAQAERMDNRLPLLNPKPAKDTVLVNMIWPGLQGLPCAASSARCQNGTVSFGDVVLFFDEGQKWAVA